MEQLAHFILVNGAWIAPIFALLAAASTLIEKTFLRRLCLWAAIAACGSVIGIQIAYCVSIS